MEIEGTTESRHSARRLRRELTKPERLLWWALKADKTGFHFRKQHAAGPYVLDFYCDNARLCVEVDGQSHDLTIDHDSQRDAYLRQLGVETVRVAARDVLMNLEGVVGHIVETARARPLRRPLADTSPKGEGR